MKRGGVKEQRVIVSKTQLKELFTSKKNQDYPIKIGKSHEIIWSIDGYRLRLF